MASPFATKWNYPEKQNFWVWSRSDDSGIDSFAIHSFTHSFPLPPTQPTDAAWVLHVSMLASVRYRKSPVRAGELVINNTSRSGGRGKRNPGIFPRALRKTAQMGEAEQSQKV